MAFSLKTFQNGETRFFTIKDILTLLGDKINDDISLYGRKYRISSCEEVNEIDSSQVAGIDWMQEHLVVTSSGLNEFSLQETITDPESLLFTVNSILYTHGESRAFHVEGNQLFWHGGFQLEPSDQVYVRYPKSIRLV